MVPPALDQTQQEELKGAVEQPPAAAGIQLANWYWRVVRQFVSERFGISLSRSSCLNWLYRLGFACRFSPSLGRPFSRTSGHPGSVVL